MNFGKARDFPAVLKTREGKILEYGTGVVAADGQGLDFKGEFVPICKMGTQLEVVRVQDEVETQRFIGEVYLSSQQMLRLVSVTDEVLPGAASAYQYSVSMEGTATATLPQPEHPRRFSLRHKHSGAVPASQTFPIAIHSISMSRIKFVSDKNLEQGQHISISVQNPIRLDSIPVEIEQPILFGPAETRGYHCQILNLTGSNYLSLEAFTRELSLRENKMFPPVSTSDEEEHP